MCSLWIGGDTMTWLMNDEPYFQLTTADHVENSGYDTPFNDPFFFILNIAVGGNWPIPRRVDVVPAVPGHRLRARVPGISPTFGVDERAGHLLRSTTPCLGTIQGLTWSF